MKNIFRTLNEFANNKFIASILFGIGMCLLIGCMMGLTILTVSATKFTAIFLFKYTSWYYDVPVLIITIFAILFYKMEE